jgi:hypothetical protein
MCDAHVSTELIVTKVIKQALYYFFLAASYDIYDYPSGNQVFASIIISNHIPPNILSPLVHHHSLHLYNHS